MPPLGGRILVIFSILVGHHTLAKLNSESKTRGGNGMSEKYVLFWKIRQHDGHVIDFSVRKKFATYLVLQPIDEVF